MKIAFAGLGVMGAPMARHLVNAGHQVVGFNRTPAKAQAWAEAVGRGRPRPFRRRRRGRSSSSCASAMTTTCGRS